MKFTQIPTDTFKNLVLNAGIMVDSFTPNTGVIGNIIGATSGGINFTATPTYSDYGEDIDNCPKNAMELKKLDSWEAKLSGTLLSVTASTVSDLVGAADVESIKVIPRNDIATTDFKDIWLVCDYSEFNGAKNGGFVAIHLMNALSTGGFQIQSSDKAKGTFAFEYTAHYSIANQDVVPFEIYVKAGTEETV